MQIRLKNYKLINKIELIIHLAVGLLILLRKNYPPVEQLVVIGANEGEEIGVSFIFHLRGSPAFILIVHRLPILHSSIEHSLTQNRWKNIRIDTERLNEN